MTLQHTHTENRISHHGLRPRLRWPKSHRVFCSFIFLFYFIFSFTVAINADCEIKLNPINIYKYLLVIWIEYFQLVNTTHLGTWLSWPPKTHVLVYFIYVNNFVYRAYLLFLIIFRNSYVIGRHFNAKVFKIQKFKMYLLSYLYSSASIKIQLTPSSIFEQL